MKQQRKNEKSAVGTPSNGSVVPNHYWAELKDKDLRMLCQASGALHDTPDTLILKYLNEDIRINMADESLERRKAGGWHKGDDSYLVLMTLVYLLNVTRTGLRDDMVGVMDLKDAHFFQGPHQLKTASLINRYGSDGSGFQKAGIELGGRPLDMADAAVCLKPFPKIPVYYLLWIADEEFPANLSILFDRSIEDHLPADAIWGIVALVSDALLHI
jgi:hypothetical protein